MSPLDELRQAGQHCQRVFEKLGSRVEHEWRRAHYDEAALPRIAAAALSEAALHKQVSHRDLTAWVMTADQSGAQPNATLDFGQPPLTLYKGRRFYVEVLQWLDSTTAIHQHQFAGAFTVLQGSSVHTTYRFEEQAKLADHMLLGDVQALQSEVLNLGEVRMIAPGRSFIHALYHLAHPSLSVVVRSEHSPNAELQYSYYPPYVALNPFDSALWANKTMGYIRGLFAMESPETPKFVGHAMEQADPRWAYTMLTAYGFPNLVEGANQALWAEVSAVARAAAQEKFGEHFAAVVTSVKEELRGSRFASLRGRIKDPDERFFLALLMNVPDPGRLLELVHERFPNEDPAARVEDWLRSLMNEKTHRAGFAIGDDALLLLPSVIRNEPFEKSVWRLEAVHGKLDADDHADIKAALDNIRGVELLTTFSGQARPPPYKLVRGT